MIPLKQRQSVTGSREAVDVILRPVASGIYDTGDYEPQMVQIRNKNTAAMLIDSQDSVLENDKTNMIVSSVRQLGDRANILAQQIKRITFLDLNILWVTPNVNPRNNVVTFYSSVTLLPYTVTIPEGFYNDPAILLDAIIAQMNVFTGISGLTFSKVAVPLMPGWFTLTSAGGAYYFDKNCNAITRGAACYALPEDQVFTSSKRVGCMSLYYTRYIDICSTKLTQYTKLPSRSTGSTSNVIIRANIPEDPTKPIGVFYSNAIRLNVNYEPSDAISSFDISIYDEYGDLLYIPQGGGPGGQSGFQWNLDFIVQF